MELRGVILKTVGVSILHWIGEVGRFQRPAGFRIRFGKSGSPPRRLLLVIAGFLVMPVFSPPRPEFFDEFIRIGMQFTVIMHLSKSGQFLFGVNQ